MDVSIYLDLFVQEASQQWTNLDASVMALQVSPRQADLEDAILAAHTLKGLAATMKLETMSTVAAFLEDYLRVLKSHFHTWSTEPKRTRVLGPVSAALDALKVLLDDAAAGRQPSYSPTQFLDKLALELQI